MALFDEDEEAGLEEELQDETVDETADEEVPSGPLDSLASIAELRKQLSSASSDAAKYRKALEQIQAARLKLLEAPSRKEALMGLAQKLAAPRTQDDPRFYERSNLYTFLRDVGEYGQERKQAEKERLAKIAALEEMGAKYGLTEAQKTQEAAMRGLTSLAQRQMMIEAQKARASTPKEDEITRLQKVRDGLDIRDPRRAELNRRIAYLGGEREGKGQEALPGEKEVDKKVGAEYADWVIGGKGAQAASRISKINDVVSQLGKRKDLSGAVVGYTLENFPTFASVLYPEAQDVKDVVESVVQTDLRAILGGQFAQQEGLALIKRAYNPRLDETKNANRLKLLARQMQLVADEKNRAMSYFGEKGTIKGYTFKPYSANDFLTSDQLRRIDAGESVESILGEAPPEKPKSESKQKPAAPSAGGAAKTPAQKAAEELARRRAAKGG